MAQYDSGGSKTRQAEIDAAFEAVIADLQMDALIADLQIGAMIEEAVDEIVPDENRRNSLKQKLGR
jgi:hypothetical protein